MTGLRNCHKTNHYENPSVMVSRRVIWNAITFLIRPRNSQADVNKPKN